MTLLNVTKNQDYKIQGDWIAVFNCGCTEPLWEPYIPSESDYEIKNNMNHFAGELARLHTCGEQLPNYTWTKEKSISKVEEI